MGKNFQDETIAAISTPEGEGGIAVIRLSGKDSEKILLQIFDQQGSEKTIEERKIYYGQIKNPIDQSKIDSVLISVMRAPRSYTGEDVVEIYSHGGNLIPKKILRLVTALNSRVALPGEFTQRAYLNGKMDLAQAEAVADLICAQSELSLKQAEKQLKGELSDKINGFKDNVLDIYAEVEAQIDFPEESIDPIIKDEILKNAEQLLINISKLLDSFGTGKIIKNGVNTTILGKPNVGKSSLLNSILKEQRAIVSDIAGTTRDFIEENINIKGITLNLTDTAGIRTTSDQVETAGVDIALQKADQAELIIIVLDFSSVIDKNDIDVLNKGSIKDHIVVINKTDLAQSIDTQLLKKYVREENVVYTSVKDHSGIDLLKEKIYKTVVGNTNIAESSELYLTDVRHKNALEKANNHLEIFIDSTKTDQSLEIMSIELRSVLDYLGEITGEVTTEDLLGRIFSRFCIGK